MNFKILETPSTMPDVLLYRDRNDSGYELVKIVAIGTVDEQEFYITTDKNNKGLIDYLQGKTEILEL